ncbi:hypothetical protein ACVXHB_09210 [Escherichia coli]
MIYGDPQKWNVLENDDVEDVAISREQQNVSGSMPQRTGKSGVSGEDWRAGVRTARHQHSAGIPD